MSVFPQCSADPLSSLSVEFDSKEEAIAFAVKNGESIVTFTTHTLTLTHMYTLHTVGWSYEVQEPKTGSLRPKSYAANFSWDKKTRVVTK